MIHPSYYELMEKINEGRKQNNEPPITSRYSIVLASSKRARQLTNGAKPRIDNPSPKVLSVAIDELYRGAVHIVEKNEGKSIEEQNEANVPLEEEE